MIAWCRVVSDKHYVNTGSAAHGYMCDASSIWLRGLRDATMTFLCRKKLGLTYCNWWDCVPQSENNNSQSKITEIYYYSYVFCTGFCISIFWKKPMLQVRNLPHCGGSRYVIKDGRSRRHLLHVLINMHHYSCAQLKVVFHLFIVFKWTSPPISL